MQLPVGPRRAAERIPAAGREGMRLSIGIEEKDAAVLRDFADGSHGNSAESPRQALCVARRHGKEQFIVIAAVQSQS